MKSKKIILSLLLSGSIVGFAHAQSVDDAVIISKDENPASARIKGMGNVQTALGGDISSINGNPAGLGFYSRSDVNITFDYLQNTNKTNFLGTNSSSNKGNFGIAQAGVVFNFPSRNIGYHGWQSTSIGISYNKRQNFNNSWVYDGVNNETSFVNNLTDLMADDSDFRNDFRKSNLVEVFPTAADGYFPLASEFDDKHQVNDVLTKGNHNNTSLAFGANYNNTFYIGATLGFSFFRYERSKIFEENGWTKTPDQVREENPNSAYANPANPELYRFLDKSYQLLDDYSQITEGSGIDLKLGMIFKPALDWNIGLTIKTPTWNTISESTRAFTDVSYFPDMDSNTSFHTYESALYSSAQDYSISTPWRFALGATKFFDRGLLSAEAEYITYNSTQYTSPTSTNSFINVNNYISEDLQGAFIVRIGGEYLLNSLVSARAGINYFGNPYKYAEETNYNASVGLGFKLSNTMYMDVAVVHQVNSYSTAPYTLSGFWHDLGSYEPVADLTHRRTNALLTLGARF